MKKIKVLYVCPNSGMGGDSQSFLDMMRGIQEKIEPIVLTRKEGPFSQECKKRGYKCIIHEYTDLSGLFAYPLKRIIKRPWRLKAIRYFVSDLKCIIYVLRRVKKNNIDLVHSNVSGCTIGMWIARLLKIPHVWHVREALDLHFGLVREMNRVRKHINKAEARIAISTAIKEHLNMNDKNTFIINDAVRSPKDASYVPCKEKYILFTAAGLTNEKESKGAPTAITAFGMSKLHKDGFKLKMVGNADEYTKVRFLKLAQSYGCEKSIEFVPFQKNIKPFFEKASAFVMASTFEGLGRTTVEAMFFGCPVIASAYSGGTLDIVKNGETGYLFNTVEECSELMRFVCLTDQNKMILRAQDFVVNHFTPDVYGPQILNVYNQILKKNESYKS